MSSGHDPIADALQALGLDFQVDATGDTYLAKPARHDECYPLYVDTIPNIPGIAVHAYLPGDFTNANVPSLVDYVSRANVRLGAGYFDVMLDHDNTVRCCIALDYEGAVLDAEAVSELVGLCLDQLAQHASALREAAGSNQSTGQVSRTAPVRQANALIEQGGTPISPETTSLREPVCSECGKVNRTSARFCVECGAPIGDPL